MSPTIQTLAIEPDAEAKAWEAVSERRRRKRRSFHVVVAVGLLVLAGSPILMQDRPAVSITATADAPERPDHPASAGAAQPDQPSEVAAFEVGGDDLSRRRPPPHVANAVPHAPTKPTQDSAGFGRKRPMERTNRTSMVLEGCFTEWCQFAWADQVDDGVAVTAELCVAQGSRVRRFSFPTSKEADLQIRNRDDSENLWQWSKGQTFEAIEHHLDLGPGDCFAWTTIWDGTDDDGAPAPSGAYVLTSTVHADQISEGASGSMTFQYDE